MSDLNKLKELRNALACWQEDYDPTEDKEQFDMFGDAVDAVARLVSAEAELDRRDAAAGEPVAWQVCAAVFTDKENATRWAIAERHEVIPLYTAPPAPSAPDSWIKCSDRMPEQKQSNRYVALNLLLNERTVAQGGFDDGEFWIEGVVVNNVTRWVPLPAAPGGEE